MTKLKSITTRFLKGAVAGAASSMAMVSLVQPESWSGFSATLNNLAQAGVFGAITGLILALQKFASWEE